MVQNDAKVGIDRAEKSPLKFVARAYTSLTNREADILTLLGFLIHGPGPRSSELHSQWDPLYV